MLNILVMVEHSQAAATALEAACQLDPDNPVHPIFTAPPAGHDLAMGAGWAWKTWERENRRRARGDVEHLVCIHRQQFQNLKTPVVVSGRMIKAVSQHFLEKGHDLIVAGTPFRGMPPETIAARFQKAIRNTSKDLPLWIANNSRPVKRITVLTDGSYPAERALGFLNRMVYGMDINITLIGLSRVTTAFMARENLNLERGFAILREKGIDAEGFTLKQIRMSGLKSSITRSDLLVLPFSSPACLRLLDRPGLEDLPSVLFYLDGDSG